MVIDKPREMLFIRDVSFMLSQALHIFDRKTAWAAGLALTPGIYSHPDSFEQLAAISRHPVISQHVTHLIYDSDILDRYESRDEWERNLTGAYLPRKTIDRLYAQYHRLFTLQEQLREKDYGVSIISEALSHLPKLTSISTSFAENPEEHYRYLPGQLRRWLERPVDNFGYGQPRGTLQLRSLLLGYYTSGTQLTRLELGDINWQFLRNESEENMRMMKQSLRHLHKLDLVISTEYDVCDHVYDIETEILECREYLNNALCNFIKAAPMLESLSVWFEVEPTDCRTELKHIVSDNHWTNLRWVDFGNIRATQADFVNFCSQHASTLRHLSLRNIVLLHPGKWIPTLETMQKTLSLDSANISGDLECDHPPGDWSHFSSCHWIGYGSQGQRTRDAISKYLVHGGTCPLRPLGVMKKHPNKTSI